MENSNTNSASPTDAPNVADAAQHVAGAHHELKSLRDRLGILNQHPELEAALTKLEMALSALAVNTGGLW